MSHRHFRSRCVFVLDEVTINVSDNEDAMSLYSFGSRADLHRVGDSPVPSWVQKGEPVIVLSSTGAQKSGTVQFIGQTEFASGPWVGVELDLAEGGHYYVELKFYTKKSHCEINEVDSDSYQRSF